VVAAVICPKGFVHAIWSMRAGSFSVVLVTPWLDRFKEEERGVLQ
jgi:hypothetical protein